MRDLDPTDPTIVGSETWSDYDGDDAYGDFQVLSSEPINEQRSYEPGIGRVDPWTNQGSSNTQYYHADHFGTTRTLSDTFGTRLGDAVYTAFGEKIGGADHRFGYAGEWGFQSTQNQSGTALFPFLHVGARYYDPSIGRFLQREALGIGANVGILLRSGAGGGDPKKKVIKSLKRIDKMRDQAIKDRAVQRVEELNVERNRLLKELDKSRVPKPVKKIVKKIVKKVGGKLFPAIGVCWFAYDWYKGGLEHALKESFTPF